MNEPELSVVVAGSRPDGPPAGLMERLGPLLAEGRAEILIASSRPRPVPDALQPGVRPVPCAPGTTVPRLRAAGWEAARGAIVALTEDFCLPAPGWAEALLTAHGRHPAIAVGGPVTRCTGSGTDWALTFCEYGRFFHVATEGAVSDLPGINVSYKSLALRRLLGGSLPHEVRETDLHAAIVRLGGTLWGDPRVVMEDASRTTLGRAIGSMYHHGRLYGGERVAGRPATARLVRAVLAPAVPAVLAVRIVRQVIPAGHGARLPGAAPALVCLLAGWAAGEGAGSLAGPGESGRRWT